MLIYHVVLTKFFWVIQDDQIQMCQPASKWGAITITSDVNLDVRDYGGIGPSPKSIKDNV